MLERLGAHVRRVDAPFEPEAGAYDAAEHDRAAITTIMATITTMTH